MACTEGDTHSVSQGKQVQTRVHQDHRSGAPLVVGLGNQHGVCGGHDFLLALAEERICLEAMSDCEHAMSVDSQQLSTYQRPGNSMYGATVVLTGFRVQGDLSLPAETFLLSDHHPSVE